MPEIDELPGQGAHRGGGRSCEAVGYEDPADVTPGRGKAMEFIL